MIFRQLFDTESSTYTYLIADEATGVAALVDPVLPQLERDLQLIEELHLKLACVLETHVHADHITSAGRLRELTGCKGIVPEHAKVGCADRFMHGGETLQLGAVTITAIATPGHTDSHLAYRIDNDRVLTGDALFIRGCGRTDFQGGNAGLLFDAVTQRLFTLPDDTLVYPAHDYRGRTTSTIGEEKRCNPRFVGRNREQFIEFMNNLKLPMPQKIMEALPANEQCGVIAAAASAESGTAVRTVKSVGAAQLKAELARADTLLIDVQEPGEYAREHIAGALSTPLSRFDPTQLPRNKRIVACCPLGVRSRDAGSRLASAGYDAFHLEGGMEAWKKAGLPTAVGLKQPIPVMRQVQIIAGSLVVIGVVLAALASPWFLLLSAIIGGGLLFAGLSGNCMMALLLARLPYNQPRSAA